MVNGKVGTKKKDSCASQNYVVPGKPEQSFIWLKTTKGQNHGCGNKMPPASKGLSDEMSDMLKAWISAGANK